MVWGRVWLLVQPRLEGQGAVGSLLLLAKPIPFPNCPVFLSQHQGVLAEGGREDGRVSIWQAGTKCFENQFCLGKAQGSQYFPTVTCLSPSPRFRPTLVSLPCNYLERWGVGWRLPYWFSTALCTARASSDCLS